MVEGVLDTVRVAARQGTISAPAGKMQQRYAINVSYYALLYLVVVLSYLCVDVKGCI